MIINNAYYNDLAEDDILVCTLGYEPRSLFLFEKNASTRNSENTLVFRIDHTEQTQKYAEELEAKGLPIIDCYYNDVAKIKNETKKFFCSCAERIEQLSFHIDYSSMPRSWYCSLALYLADVVTLEKKLYFWYNAGDYPHSYDNYPSAGIDSISVFDGISLPAIDIKRYHIMGLGYDNIRTETVKSIVEPDSLIVCYAYNPYNMKTKRQVYEVNEHVIESSLMSVALPIDNFSGMIDKLCNLTYDQLLQNAQVIFIPDGPKPLIMAMSLIPYIVNMPGVTCLHISRNNNHYKEIAVSPRENEIYGFRVLQ